MIEGEYKTKLYMMKNIIDINLLSLILKYILFVGFDVFLKITEGKDTRLIDDKKLDRADYTSEVRMLPCYIK